MSLPRPDTNAKYIFFIGLLGLPWLWMVNVMYHWRVVYGKVPSCCGIGGGSEREGEGVGEGEAANNTNETESSSADAAGLLAMMADEDGNADGENQQDTPSPEVIQMELSKWIKRSTIGSFIYTTAFISWVLVFQLNKDNFGPKWFVMTQDEEIKTGW